MYSPEMSFDAQNFEDNFTKDQDLEIVMTEIYKYYVVQKNLLGETYKEENFGLFLINCEEIRV